MQGRWQFLLVPFILVYAATSAEAGDNEETQFSDLPSWSIGPQLGFNIARTSGSGELEIGDASDEFTFSSQGHLKLGGHVTLARSRYALRLEVAYSGKGGDVSDNVEELQGVPYKLQYDMRYLSVPLLGIVHIPYDGELSPHFFAGPEVSVLLSSDVHGEAVVLDDTGEPATVEQDSSLKNATETLGLGAVVGAGMRYPAGKGAVVVDIRFAFDFTKAIVESEVMTFMGAQMRSTALRHRVLTVGIGYEY